MAASIWGGGRMKRWHIQISWSLSMLDTIMVLSNLIDQSLAYPTPHVVYSGLWSKEVMCLWEKDSGGCDASLIELFYPYETMESLVGKHTSSFAYDVYISSFTTLPNAPTPDRELHWFLSPKEWSEETWHLVWMTLGTSVRLLYNHLSSLRLTFWSCSKFFFLLVKTQCLPPSWCFSFFSKYVVQIKRFPLVSLSTGIDLFVSHKTYTEYVLIQNSSDGAHWHI